LFEPVEGFERIEAARDGYGLRAVRHSFLLLEFVNGRHGHGDPVLL
jgi:hypothetical protein